MKHYTSNQLSPSVITRPPKLLAIFPGLDPAQGGVQVSALSAIPAVAEDAFEAIVFGADPTGAVADARQSVIDENKYRLMRRIVACDWQSDVMLVWHVRMLKLLPLIRGFRGRVVMFCHGIELWRQQSWLTRRLLRRVDLFLSNSDYTWKRFLEFAPYLRGASQVTTPLGFGLPLSGSAPTPNTVPSAVIVARMDKREDYKGHRELIEAWPKLLVHVPDARLDVIGDGNLRPELEALVSARNLGNRVRFVGRVDEELKTELLAASRCLAMPSRGEGFGLVYLEAMRLGRPCLVSDCDAGREVVNPPEAGLAVNTRDLQALAAALVRLLTDCDEWQARSLAARRRYEANYTAAQFPRRLRAAICELPRNRLETLKTEPACD